MTVVVLFLILMFILLVWKINSHLIILEFDHVFFLSLSSLIIYFRTKVLHSPVFFVIMANMVEES